MKKYEFSGKNLQETIDKGLKELKLKQEDVDIKILNEGGLFSKAKVMIITEEIEEVKEKTPVVEKKVIKETKKVKKAVSKNNTTVTNIKSIDFIKELIGKLNNDATIKVEENEKEILVNIEGDNLGNLIGYRGECLRSIQYLSNVIALKNNTKEKSKRISIDIENYKEKRKEALISLANRIAEKVIRTDCYQKLEPMNSYERLIIHSALSDKDVTTESHGEEPRRYLVIAPKK